MTLLWNFTIISQKCWCEFQTIRGVYIYRGCC